MRYWLMVILICGLGAVWAQNPALDPNSGYEAGIYEARTNQGLPSFSFIFKEEFFAGLYHIFSGLDHIAFVLGLILLIRKPTAIIKIISFFTLAHALTLTLTSLEILSIGPIGNRIIEIIIALSILWVGIENLLLIGKATKQKLSIEQIFSLRNRYILAFVFGLIHGIAFSEHFRQSMLQIDFALPGVLVKFLFKILCFNLGVDFGQILVVLIALAAGMLFVHTSSEKEMRRTIEAKLTTYGNYAIASLGLLWTLQRLFA